MVASPSFTFHEEENAEPPRAAFTSRWGTWNCKIILYFGFWNVVGGVTKSRLFACIWRSFGHFPRGKGLHLGVKILLAAFSILMWRSMKNIAILG